MLIHCILIYQITSTTENIIDITISKFNSTGRDITCNIYEWVWTLIYLFIHFKSWNVKILFIFKCWWLLKLGV
jgi:hypothetical protein